MATTNQHARPGALQSDIVHPQTDENTNTPLVQVANVLSADMNSTGQAIVFPQRHGHVEVSVQEIAPGATLPTHKHPFPRMGYVLSGILRVTNVDKRTTITYAKGEFTLESVNEWHTGENPGSEWLKLLVIDLTEMVSQNTQTK